MHYLWRKRADAKWLTRNETLLDAMSHGKHAIIELPKRTRLVVELLCATAGAAEKFRDRFGGTVERISAAQLRAAMEPRTRAPLRIGNQLVVVSSRTPSAANALVIPAGAAFGTGEHVTTAMSLRLLARFAHSLGRGWSLLDLGTGSGILALAAARFGATRVIAIDNDPLAIRTARQNAALNRISAVEFLHGDALRPQTATRFDIITANLYSELLVRGLPRWRKLLRHDGRVILSGVLREQEPEVTKALLRNDFELLLVRRRPKWIALMAAPSSSTPRRYSRL